MTQSGETSLGSKLLATFGATLLVLSAVLTAAGPGAFVAVAQAADQALNPDAQHVGGATLNATYQVEEHNRSEMESALEYYDNEGEISELNGSLLTEDPDPVTVDPTRIHADELSQFPRKSDENESNSAAWSNGWGVSGDSTNASATVETRNGKDYVVINKTQSDGLGYFSYGNFSITEDVGKRVLLLVVDVNRLDSGFSIQLRDEDGDARQASITANPGPSQVVVANSTGTAVVQIKVNEMRTINGGNGDGLQELDDIRIYGDGSYEMEIHGLNVERKSMVSFGETVENNETSTLYNFGGPAELTSLSSMGSWANDATIHDVEVDTEQSLDTGGVDAQYDLTERDPSEPYAWKIQIHTRYETTDAYDVSLQSATLSENVPLSPDQRLYRAELIEGAGDQSYEDLEGSSAWTDVSGTMDSKNDTAVLDDTIQSGTTYVLVEEWLWTDAEKNSGLVAPGGGVGGPMSGGFWNAVFGPIGALVGAVLAFLGIRGGSN